MSFLVFLIIAVVQGLIVGALARLALPGKDPLSIPQTILVGMGGALLAGVIVYFVSGGNAAPGFLATFVGAVLIVYLIRRSRGGGLTSQGRQAEQDPARLR